MLTDMAPSAAPGQFYGSQIQTMGITNIAPHIQKAVSIKSRSCVFETVRCSREIERSGKKTCSRCGFMCTIHQVVATSESISSRDQHSKWREEKNTNDPQKRYRFCSNGDHVMNGKTFQKSGVGINVPSCSLLISLCCLLLFFCAPALGALGWIYLGRKCQSPGSAGDRGFMLFFLLRVL